MVLSTDVRLPKDLTPVWPDRCVRCGAPSPSGRARLSDRSTTWWTTVTLSFAPKLAVAAPACEPCARALAWQQRGASVGMGLSIVVGVGFGLVVLVPRFPAVPAALVLGASGLLACAPLVLWRVFRAPAFAILAWGDTVDYQFRDAELAREFAALNGVEVR